MLEKDKLGPRQHDQPLATMYLVGLLIERQISDLQDGPCVRVHPPGNNTEPGSQNVERKRLGEVIVGAHVEPANNIRNRISSSQHQYWRSNTARPEPAGHRQAVEPWKHNVQDNRIKRKILSLLQTVETVLGNLH